MTRLCTQYKLITHWNTSVILESLPNINICQNNLIFSCIHSSRKTIKPEHSNLLKRCAFFGLASSFLSDRFSVLHLNILTAFGCTKTNSLPVGHFLYHYPMQVHSLQAHCLQTDHCRLVDIDVPQSLQTQNVSLYMLI